MILWIFVTHYIISLTYGYQQHFYYKYYEYSNSWELPRRLLLLMRSYYDDVSQRLTEMNHFRFMYEESPYYETGYLMHEIIERYKHMVEHMHGITDYKSNTIFDCIERTEQIQKLYFEIYHLVNMVHEIPQKYIHIKEFSGRIKKFNGTAHANAANAMKDVEAKLRREKRQRLKLFKKRREQFLEGVAEKDKATGPNKKPFNPHWPLDYGWEIESWV